MLRKLLKHSYILYRKNEFIYFRILRYKFDEGDIIKIDMHPDDIYINNIEGISFKPVFIMGLHRSGSSILYKILGKTGELNMVTAYHILKYDELIYNYVNNLEGESKKKLNKLFRNKGITDRKFDSIEVNSDYAHEYVYIFTERGYPSKITYKNKWLFENLCKKIKYISENDKSILLKNPYDYTNFLFIKMIYPNAKFIFIHRNPLQTISSTMRLWQILLKNKNEYTALFSKKYNQTFEKLPLLFLSRLCYTSRLPIGLFDVIHYSARTTKYFLKNINQLSKEDYISIRYEDLCREPNRAIAGIMDFLHLESNIDHSNYIKPRNLKVIPEVKTMKKYILKKMKPYFEYFEYSI